MGYVKNSVAIGLIISSVFAIDTFAQDPTDGPGGSAGNSIGIPAERLRRRSRPLPTDVVTEEAAGPKPFVKSGALSIYNVDRIMYLENRVGFAQPGRGKVLKWYGGEVFKINGDAKWIDYDGYKFLGQFDTRLDDGWNMNGELGVGQMTLKEFLSVDHGKKRTEVLHRLKTVYEVIPRTELRLEVNNDFTYNGWLDRSNNSQVLMVENAFFEVESFSVDKWNFRSNVRESWIEDGNRQEVFDHLILRELFNSPFVFKVGVGGGWMRFTEQRPHYWNPEHFQTYGGRLLITKAFAKFWNFEARYHAGKHREKNRPIGTDTAAEFQLHYRSRRNVFFKLIGNFLNSEGGAWWRRDFTLNAEFPI